MMEQNNINGDQVKSVDGTLQSVYFSSSEIIKQQLDNVSPSFCLAKWFNVSIHIPNGQTHSCYHPRSHHIPLEEVKIDVSALHNTKYKKEQRALMLSGVRPPECSFCWEIEDSGNNLSDRAYRSKDVFENGIIEEALELGSTGNAKPRYLEVNFNQACNFRCTYCSPHLSTAWQKDIDKNGPYKLSDRVHNDLKWLKENLPFDNSPDNPYLKAFWEWFPTIYDGLSTFRMTGGEPLMDKNTFKIFDFIKEHHNQKLNLSITSNCNPPGDQWSKFMTELKEITSADAIDHFMLFCSLDSWDRQAEYIRDGMDFNKLYSNISEYLSTQQKHSLTFIITFNVLSYSKFFKFVQSILFLRKVHNTDRQLIWFDVPQLSSPEWMDPRLAPEMIVELEKTLEFMESNKENEKRRFKGFKDFEISKVQRLIDWIKTSKFDRSVAVKNFYLYFSEHDKRRGSNLLEVFPELNNLWIEGKLANGK
jgi:sulfatase maturation enzyme AslB (radical SAM superfamily)